MWSLPRVERDAGRIRFSGGAIYEPAREPALWRRIAALASLGEDDRWFLALMRHGPLTGVTLGMRDESPEREAWERTIAGLAEVAACWEETSEGSNLWELPTAAPIELTDGYHRVRKELRRIAESAVRLELEGLALTPAPATLDAFIWLSAAESVREKHRFRRCERCGGWFSIQRSDARFCSAICRNKREVV